MYEKFTDRSRKVMVLANHEALRSNLDYVGTEHVLVGLVAEGGGVAAHALQLFDLDLEKIRKAIESRPANGVVAANHDMLPQETGTEKLIEFSLEEAAALDHRFVGTEHLLLGMIRDKDSVATDVLKILNVDAEQVRTQVLSLLGGRASHEILTASGAPTNRSLFSATASKLRTFAHRVLSAPGLVAVDIGNSRVKLGRFDRRKKSSNVSRNPSENASALILPEPTATLDLPIKHDTCEFDTGRLFEWCGQHAAKRTDWLIGSVHRNVAERLTSAVAGWANWSGANCAMRQLTYRDISLTIRVDEPDRVGIDRLLAAMAADRLRDRNRAAIVVDLGTAITVDLVEADGAFAGGAILPGMGMSARALEEQTDALPRVVMDHVTGPPPPVGKSTVPAIEAGIFWGAVGAITEVVSRQSTGLAAAPDLFVTGGAAAQVTELLAEHHAGRVSHVPHLVLAGIALVGAQVASEANG